MSLFRRLPRFLLLKYLLFLACLLWAGVGPAAVSGKSKGSEPLPITNKLIDNLIVLDPSFAYSDAQRMTDVSGRLTAIFKAQGSYTFRSEYGRGRELIKRVSLDLTMTVKYTRSGKSELITGAIGGTKITTEDAPPKNDDPGVHRVETVTYSGSETRNERGFALKTLLWSKELKLACFETGLGPGQGNLLEVPCNFHLEWVDKDEKKSVDGQSTMMAAISSHGTSNTFSPNW